MTEWYIYTLYQFISGESGELVGTSPAKSQPHQMHFGKLRNSLNHTVVCGYDNLPMQPL